MFQLTHWGWVMDHRYASANYVNIGPGNGLSPEGREAIFRTNADIMSIGPSETNFSEILIKIQKFS